jgi:hypothetical protein
MRRGVHRRLLSPAVRTKVNFCTMRPVEGGSRKDRLKAGLRTPETAARRSCGRPPAAGHKTVSGRRPRTEMRSQIANRELTSLDRKVVCQNRTVRYLRTDERSNGDAFPPEEIRVGAAV